MHARLAGHVVAYQLKYEQVGLMKFRIDEIKLASDAEAELARQKQHEKERRALLDLCKEPRATRRRPRVKGKAAAGAAHVAKPAAKPLDGDGDDAAVASDASDSESERHSESSRVSDEDSVLEVSGGDGDDDTILVHPHSDEEAPEEPVIFDEADGKIYDKVAPMSFWERSANCTRARPRRPSQCTVAGTAVPS